MTWEGFLADWLHIGHKVGGVMAKALVYVVRYLPYKLTCQQEVCVTSYLGGSGSRIRVSELNSLRMLGIKTKPLTFLFASNESFTAG